MALEIEKGGTRRFVYNGTTLADPSPGMSPEKVREFYSSEYPELANAAISTTTKDGVMTYAFTRAIGTKG